MCSPAQFRQQSAELYAVIDEVLADSIPPVSGMNPSSYLMNKCPIAACRVDSAALCACDLFVQTPQHSRTPTPTPGQQAKVANWYHLHFSPLGVCLYSIE